MERIPSPEAQPNKHTKPRRLKKAKKIALTVAALGASFVGGMKMEQQHRGSAKTEAQKIEQVQKTSSERKDLQQAESGDYLYRDGRWYASVAAYPVEKAEKSLRPDIASIKALVSQEEIKEYGKIHHEGSPFDQYEDNIDLRQNPGTFLRIYEDTIAFADLNQDGVEEAYAFYSDDVGGAKGVLLKERRVDWGIKIFGNRNGETYEIATIPLRGAYGGYVNIHSLLVRDNFLTADYRTGSEEADGVFDNKEIFRFENGRLYEYVADGDKDEFLELGGRWYKKLKVGEKDSFVERNRTWYEKMEERPHGQPIENEIVPTDDGEAH